MKKFYILVLFVVFLLVGCVSNTSKPQSKNNNINVPSAVNKEINQPENNKQLPVNELNSVGTVQPSVSNTNQIENPNQGVFVTKSGFKVSYDKIVAFLGQDFQLSVSETSKVYSGNNEQEVVEVLAKSADSQNVTTINIFARDKQLTEMENVVKVNSVLINGEICEFAKKGDIYTLASSPENCMHNWADSGYIVYKEKPQYIVYYHLGQEPMPSQNFTIEPVKQ